MLIHTDIIGKQRAPPQSKDRTMKVLTLTEGLGLTEPGIKVFDDSSFNEQQGRRILTWYEEILKDKNRPLPRHNSVLNSKASPGTRASRPT
jgi:hypothetical protein